METPERPTDQPSDSADTPDTNVPSIFDSDSPLSSAISLSSDYQEEGPIKTVIAPQQPPVTDGDSHDAWVNHSLYGQYTAASQRSQRTCKKPEQFPGFSQLPKEILEEEPHTLPISDHSAIPNAQDVEQDEAQPQQPLPKRNRQTSKSNVTEQPPKKKVKGDAASPEPDFKPAVRDVTPAPRQLRKRKAASPTPAPAKTPPTKKAKIVTPKSAAATNSTPSARKPALKAAVKKSTRSTRPPVKFQASVTLVPRTKKEIVRSTLLVKLKMHDGWNGEWECSKSVKSNADATTTLNNTALHESASFGAAGESQEQYAQPAWTPIPASSQLSSHDGSQATQPTSQLQAVQPFDEEPNARQHTPTQASQTKDSACLNLHTSDAMLKTQAIEQNYVAAEASIPQEQPQEHGEVIMGEGDLSGSFSTLSCQSTQPTLLLDEPWNPVAARAAPLLTQESQKEADVSRNDEDIDSNATTEDEGNFDMPQPRRLSDEQQRLYDISSQLFANRNAGTKPAPTGQPAVWADGRQELCETLHYFRSYQSACYATGGFVRAFMFDKVAHARDYMDSDVVISRAGGGLAKDKDSGEMKFNSDQKEDSPIVQALRNCMKHFNPLVIITGLDNPHIPSQPPHQYCVLDYFKPTHIWFEKSGKSKILRYRFEKLNMKKESWWKPENEEPVDLDALEPPVEQTCVCCKEMSLQIYLNGWMCLQPRCPSFWRIIDDLSLGTYKILHEPDEASLVYDPRFLKQKTPWPNDNTEYPLAFNAPEISTHAIAGEDTSQAFWSGMVCRDCGKCNSRLGWTGWECSNSNCSFKKEPPHSLIPALAFRDPFWPLTYSYTMSRDWQAPLIPVSVSFKHGYRINRYSLPGLDDCFITHMIANKTVLEEPGGPDAMFEELQQTEIGLRRRPMPNGQLKGESCCRHFTVNYGMPYKFIAATASHSFEGAARPITATRSRLNWAARALLGPAHNFAEEFNEVLALGYFESQKINYHDDGEFGLGPTIATLSLGAPATMRIRMKARPYHGCSTAGVYDPSRPLPGCESYERRLALHSQLEALKASDPKAYRVRLREIPKELKLKSAGNAKDVLKMELGHGDIVVMHGAEVQKYFEHAVEHAGKLRFALTCRYIDPKSLEEGDRPGYVVGRDEGGYDGSKLC